MTQSAPHPLSEMDNQETTVRSSIPAASRLSALVVDDEPQIRNALRRLLVSLGFLTVVAASAEEAFALAEHESFTVVLTDIRMPGMGGVSLLQRLSPLQPSARFLIVTGLGSIDPRLLPRGHQVRVFPKPWNQEELIRAIQGASYYDKRSSYLPLPAPLIEERTRLLLIEDSPTDVALFEAGLRLRNPGQYEVTATTSVAEARQALRREEFDVVCMDLELPDASGLEAVVRIQAEAPDLGLVVLSGTDDDEVALRAVQYGAQDYLVKGKVGGSSIHRALRYAKERKLAEKRLAEMALHDQLTGLANRILFRQRLAKALGRSKRDLETFGVLIVDLDRFKAINDGLGHDAGDAFLQLLADRLRQVVRAADTVARLGGDEFVILLESVSSKEQLAEEVQRILASIRRSAELNGTRLCPTASIGAAVFPDAGKTCDELLAAADAAMYAAKKAGRNTFQIYGEELRTNATQRLVLEDQLRKAAQCGELELHYQPQVSQDPNWLSAEALLRWKRADGYAPAGEIISVIEESGLIIELGPWIFRTASEQLRQWRVQGLDVARIAINVSAKQFATGRVVNEIREATQAAGLVPSDIELEITESTLIHNTELMQTAIGQLRTDGYRLALDDFGTGYSSLSNLDQFPIDTIKIDKSFTRDIGAVRRRRELVGGVIQLSRRMGLDVIAEGVETQQQLAVLSAEGCPIMQGFLFGKALPGASYPSIAPRTPRW